MKETIYFPNKCQKMGILIWKEMFNELWTGRELIYRFFIRDISVKYRQSLLGYLWPLILPMVAIGSFIFLNRHGILNIKETDLPYPLFALLGLTVWQLFSSGIVTGTSSLTTAGTMIVKINFPRETLVFSTIGQVIFEFIIKIVLILLCYIYYNIVPNWTILLFPLAVIPMVIFTLSLSMFLSLVNCILRDTVTTISIIVNFLLFLTPVLYPVSETGSLVFKLNPLTILVNAPRELVVHGYIKDPSGFLTISLVSVVMFLFTWRIFHIVEKKIPERM